MRRSLSTVRRPSILHSRSIIAVCVVAMLVPVPGLRAQQVPERSLGPREAQSSETFSQVRGFRELSDGRLLVTDQIEKKIVLLDLDRHTATRVGRVGHGPGEYTIALDLIAMPHDTTLLSDIGRGLDYLAIITPDGTLDGAFHMPEGLHSSYIFAADRRGNLYVPETVGRRLGEALPESTVVVRVDVRHQRADTAFWVRTVPRNPNGPLNPYNPRNQWTVGADGRIAIVDVTDYHVTWITPDGKRMEGAPIPYKRLAVTAKDEEEFRALARRVGGLGIAGISTTGGGARRPAQELPSHKPPFFGNDALHIAPNGELWVRRAQPAGETRPLHDIIDGSGRRAATVRLPADTKLLALGEHGVYLAHYDQDDVIRIERYRYP